MKAPAVWLALAACAAACSGSGGLPCSDELPCPEGQSCDKNGACVQAGKLRIATEELAAAAVGAVYQFTVQAGGGLPPYHDWAEESGLGWLSIDAATGTLQGNPDRGTLGVAVTVSVYDSSFGDGDKASRSFQLVVFDCDQEGLQMECFESDGTGCSAGLRTCSGGLWSACVHGGPSQDFEQCDAGCTACDPNVADRCLGTCRCGDGPACAAGLRCCLAVCLDTGSSVFHCGECGNACNEETVLHASGISCAGGKCTYVSCRAGYLDCDGDTSNGCETAVDANHCGSCEVDCTAQVTGVAQALCVAAGPEVYRCDYDSCAADFYDCDALRRNGCEAFLGSPQSCGGCGVNCLEAGTNLACVVQDGNFVCGCAGGSDCSSTRPEQCCQAVCLPLDDASACGSCQNDCRQSPRGPWCIDAAQQRCGCFSRFDCGTKELCCDGACLPVDDSHCGDCAIACNASYGGPHCDVFFEQCYCVSNAECAGYGSGLCQGTGAEARCQ